MIVSSRIRFISVLAVVLAGAVLLWCFFGRSRAADAAPLARISTPAKPVAQPENSGAVAAPAIPPVRENPAEIAATARMYAAHAPLRVPELADPDSATNKQILQTMVTKALAQSAQPASGPAPTRP